MSATTDVDNDPETPNYSSVPTAQLDPVDLVQPNYTPTGDPLYVGPNGDGSHQVQLPDGSLQSVPFEGLTPQLQNDAVQVAATQPAPANPSVAQQLAQQAAVPGVGGSAARAQQTVVPNTTSPTQGLPDPPMVAPAGYSQRDWDMMPQDQKQIIAQSTPTPGVSAAGSQTYPGGSAAPAPQTAPAPTDGTQTQTPALPPLVDSTTAPAAKATGGGGGARSAPDQTETDTKAANEAQAKVDTDLAAAKLPARREIGADQADMVLDQKVRHDAEARKLDAIQSQQESIYRNFVNQQVDPDRYWHNKSANQQGMARMMMVIGGVGAGLAGGSNPAVDALHREQDQDIASQKYNIEHGKEASEMGSKLLADYRANGLSQDQATAAMGLTLKDKMMTDDENKALSFGGQEAHAKLLAANAPVHLDVQAKLAAIQKEHADAYLANMNARKTGVETQQLGLTGNQSQSVRDAQTNLANGHAYQDLPPQQRRALLQNAQTSKMLLPNTGIAQREVTAEDHDKAQAIEQSSDTVKDIDDLTRDTAINPGNRKQAAGAATALKAILPKALGTTSKLSEGAQAALDNLVPEKPGDLLTLWKAHGDEIKKAIARSQKAFHKSLGLTPFQAPPRSFEANR
jgi:hypothetical protein